jgi:hypothetical protein
MVTTENTVIIDDEDYQTVDEQYYIHYVGEEVVEFTVKKTAVSLYDHEYRLNEAKRQINLLNSSYVDIMEKQLTSLLT